MEAHIFDNIVTIVVIFRLLLVFFVRSTDHCHYLETLKKKTE
jgi:hypothetical protein